MDERTSSGRTHLGAIAPGGRCTVARVGCDGCLGQRLGDLGLVPGEEILVVRNAPLRDPIEIKVSGFLVSLRRCEASLVEVMAQ
ncbi:FeoA family protein [Desulfovibrio sp. DV]|uniref:FeoA family protein n=1 Tax=Desulfovibrio sp. DV TaxID=1844708 RepID=UPI00094BAC2E|nr:FeoA family protein [Desulfovibrio sp. DV]